MFKFPSLGIVTTIAGKDRGFMDGNRDDVLFNEPRGLALDKAENIYVADSGNNRIRKIVDDGNFTFLLPNDSERTYLWCLLCS